MLDEWAAAHAEEELGALSPRWRHCEAVAERARQVAATVPKYDREILVAAAFLHDMGYAQSIRTTGFHPLDGAWHLRALGAERLAGLVAYHSAARQEAALRGLSSELAAFDDERSAVSNALTYADLTTGGGGEPCSLAQRIAEVQERHGVDAIVSRTLVEASDELGALVGAVEDRLARAVASVSRSPAPRGWRGSR